MYPENFNEKELAEIGKAALSNKFSGDEYEAFTGSNDASLDFHGQGINLSEKVKGHVAFRCAITNKLKTKDLTVVIFPAYLINPILYGVNTIASSIIEGIDDGKGLNHRLDRHYEMQSNMMKYLSLNGINADILMLDGRWYSKVETLGKEGTVVTYNEIANVVSSLPGKTVSGFIEFCQRNATRIPEILIASNTTDTYTQVMRIKQISPARELGEKTIYLGEYFDQKNNRVDYITVPTDRFGASGLQFDDQTLIIMNIPAATDDQDTTVNFTFKFGVSQNAASELATKAAIAKSDSPIMIKKSMVNMPAIKASLTA